jgi:hypothetical protein
MIITQLLIVILLLQTPADYAQGRGWRGIVPLYSTRADVERVLGPPMEGLNFAYDMERERILVRYQEAPCRVRELFGRPPVYGGWVVPPDTVISIEVYPKTKIGFSDLQLDKTKYKEVRPAKGGYVYYVNEEEGRTFEVDGKDGTLHCVAYGGTPEDERLRCPKQ